MASSKSGMENLLLTLERSGPTAPPDGLYLMAVTYPEPPSVGSAEDDGDGKVLQDQR